MSATVQFSRIWLFAAVVCCISYQAMDEKKRAPKCSGCGWKHSDHSFAQVGPYCTGPETEQHDNLQLIPNFYLLIMQISIFLIPEKLVSDQNQYLQLRKSARKFGEPLPKKEVDHIN